MEYLLLCCFNEREWEGLSEPQRGEIMREYGEWIRNLDRSGRHRASAQLLPSSAASTVRGRNGRPVVTDGPFAETKEQLGGYHLIECDDLDEAIALAKQIPTIAYGGTVEVRPLAPAAGRHADPHALENAR